MSFTPIQFRFQIIPFFTLMSLALVILASWLLPESRAIWDQLDRAAFLLLNGSLEPNDASNNWNRLWAIMNSRIVDVFTLILMLSVLLANGITFKQNQALMGLTGFILILALWLILRESLLDNLINMIGWNRASPSLQIESTIRLSKLFPTLSPKDATAHGFPGDHAAVLFLWLSYSLHFVKNRWSFFIGIMTIFLTLPRLISGAHWLTDVFVGSTVITCVVLALGIYTPLLNLPLQITHLILKKISLIADFFKKN